MATYLKCHSCKGKVDWGKLYFKWKDKTHMTKVNVCKPCWDRARSLKVLEKE